MSNLKTSESVDFSILVVDDTPFIVEALKTFLSSFSADVLEAANGKEGLEIYKKRRPAFVITDIVMPVMNGLEMSKEIKKIDKNAFIVLTTALEDSDKLVEAIEISIDKYLPKPIDLKRLEKILLEFAEVLATKNAANKNRKLLEEYKKALDSAAILTITDPDGIIKYVNDEFVHTTGFSKEEAIGNSHSIIRHPETPKGLFRAMWHDIKNKKIWKGVIENKTKDGESFFVDNTIVPILGVDGEIVEYIGISFDITGIRDMSHRNLQSIFDADESLIIVTDDRFEITIANKAMLKMLEVESMSEFYKNGGAIYDRFLLRDGFLSKDDLVGSGHKDRYKKFKKLLTDGDKRHRKVAMLTPSGEERYYAVRVSTISDKMIHNRHYNIFSFVDITELEFMRQQQIDNIKLSSIGKLAAGITHEINTPLTYIKGNLEILKMDLKSSCASDLKDEFISYCEAMEDGIKRMSSIVESMREIAGVSRDEKMPINVYTTIVYSLRMVYNRAKQICNIRVNGRPFDMLLDKDGERIMMMAAPQRLEQVWIIILNNALDEFNKSKLAFNDRFIDIEVLEKLDTINVTIKDNAGGIEDSILPHIFEIFKSSKPQSGMGVGLNIAKTIVEDHNGTISAANNSEGAVFEIVFKKNEES
ncbi:MAG: response regulator [Campylobacteraceae bacterium]|jgi:PAS domain S-box-containing protein|nr:response regulator [Campylobacteraceae bacterium]